MLGTVGRARGQRAVRRFLLAGLVVPLTIAGFAPAAHADGNTTITPEITRTTQTVSVGNLARYVVTLTNSGPAQSNKGLVFTVSTTPGANIQSRTQTSGPSTWACTAPSGTSATCTLAAGMIGSEVDKFEVIVQAPSTPGDMTVTASVAQGVPSQPHPQATKSASDTVTVASGTPDGSGTFGGYCPASGCTFTSGPGTTRVTIVFATGGFDFVFDLAAATTCGVTCTGLTLGADTIPATATVTFTYDPSVVNAGLGGTPVTFKYTGTDKSTGGTPIASDSHGQNSDGSYYVIVTLAPGDPRVGNFYVPPTLPIVG